MVLSIKLINATNSASDASGAHQAFYVEDSDSNVNLTIFLRRTVRVPDNGSTYGLPPDLGAFPIYNVLDYQEKLPEALVRKGGVFISIYQREAMWIDFKTDTPFAVKVYVGGVNAISGEPKVETESTLARRKQLLSHGKNIQDYVVPPVQNWLDGVAKEDGKVMQFVATPTNSGYSVEAQITGNDSIAGVQFEIIPVVSPPIPVRFDEGCWPSPTMQVFVKVLDGKTVTLECAPSSYVQELKSKLQYTQVIPNNAQRLIFGGRQLEDFKRLWFYDISRECTLHLVSYLRGGSDRVGEMKRNKEEAIELAVAAGGSIKQVIMRDSYSGDQWDAEHGIMFNLQLFDAGVFKQVLGIDPPSTPVNAEAYAKHGYPFFDLNDDLSGVQNEYNFKSVGELDKAAGVNDEQHKDEQGLVFPTVNIGSSSTPRKYVSTNVKLNTVESMSKFLPISALTKMVKEATLQVKSDVASKKRKKAGIEKIRRQL